MLDWIAIQLRSIIGNTHGAACLLGIAIGVFLTECLAHVLPPTMPAYYADRLTRLCCFGTSMIVTFAMDVTLTGLFLAVLAGLAGPTVHGVTLRYIAARWPSLTPKSLVDNPGDAVRPTLRSPENLP